MQLAGFEVLGQCRRWCLSGKGTTGEKQLPHVGSKGSEWMYTEPYREAQKEIPASSQSGILSNAFLGFLGTSFWRDPIDGDGQRLCGYRMNSFWQRRTMANFRNASPL